MKEITGYTVLLIVVLLYIVTSLRYTLWFRRHRHIFKSARKIHFVLIWLIPFIWGGILKMLSKTTPGSHEVQKKKDSAPFFDAYQAGGD